MAQVVQKQPKSCTFAPIFCNKFASSSSLISVKIYFSLFVILSWNDQWALKTLDTLRRNFWQTAVLFLLLGPEKGHWKYFLSLKICLTKGWVCVRSYWKTVKFVSFSFSYLVGGSDEGPTPISEPYTHYNLYLSKLQNVFVPFAKCICPNWQIYLSPTWLVCLTPISEPNTLQLGSIYSFL